MSGEKNGDRAMWEATKETTYREADRDENKDQQVKGSEANEGRRQLRRVLESERLIDWRSQKEWVTG